MLNIALSKQNNALPCKMHFRRKLWNNGARVLTYIGIALVVLLLSFLIGYIVYRGVPFLSWELLTEKSSYLKKSIGILPNVVNTIYIIIVSMTIVLPLGIGAAIYLNEYASNRKLINMIEFAADSLTGIPSIIFGLAGMVIFTEMMGLKQGILAGGLTLVMMILPVIMRTTQESLKTVPMAYRESAMALGGDKWYVIRTVVLPNSLDGIVTGGILSVGRIVGESAALLFTAGFGLGFNDFISALESSSATLTVSLYVYACERGETGVAFAIALVLLCVTLALNLITNIVAVKFKSKQNV